MEGKEVQSILDRKMVVGLHVDQDGLLFKVLATEYEIKFGIIKDGGDRTFLWWMDLARVEEGM